MPGLRLAGAARFAAGASLVLLVAAAVIPACSQTQAQARATPPAAPPVRPAAPPPPPPRNGRFSETVNGVETVNPAGRLLVKARGAVSVEGSDDSVVRYTLVKHASARSEAAAKNLFQQYQVRVERSGDLTTLRFLHGGDDAASSEVVLKVPRGMREVSVETHGGSVAASDLTGAVKAVTGGGPMSLDGISGRVTALTAGGDIVLGTIGGPIQCRSAGGSITAAKLSGEADIRTAGGDIDVADVQGALRASTAGGGIRITRAGASVMAETAGGSIDVREAHGLVTARNQGGPVDVGASDGAVIETAGGTIRLGAISGNVRAATAVGNIHAYLVKGLRVQASTLTTGGGDITVWIPVDYPVTIRAENASSNAARAIVTDFPLTIRTAGSVAVAEGNIGGGGPLLRLSGIGGTINIKKREGTTREE
jgi:DUF4097 and DUF4098 domain-containing protein YvlB